MTQGLFAAHGAQPKKPSRWKPVWTDRFFTGYVTNRSPLRSPLSAIYSDSYNVGRADTLLAGVNTEISPRLTVVRRPGNPAFTTTTLPTAPNTFYSYKLANGQIYVMVDTATGIYTVTPTAKTLIQTKDAGAAQANFCGLGNVLYWGDATTARAWNPVDNAVRQLGIDRPPNPNGYANYHARGSATPVIGPNFSAGGYVSTAVQLANNPTQSVELLLKTSGTGNMPLISFESSQTGTSATVYQALYLNDGNLFYSYFDGTTQQSVVVAGSLNDNQWHQVGFSVQYVPDITNAVSYLTNGPVQSTSAGSQNLNLDASVVTNFSFNTSPAFSSANAPHKLQISLFIDGQQGQSFTPDHTFASGNGYWRIANTSLFPTTAFPGLISEVSTRSAVMVGVKSRFSGLMLSGDPLFLPGPGLTMYEYMIANSTSGLNYWWKLNESSGTVAVESVAGVNSGTYQPTVTLHQSATVGYVAYAASTAFTLNQVVVDTNGNLQQVTTAGTSGATAPTWATVRGSLTADGTVVWTNIGPGSVNLTTGRKYTYAYVNKYGHFSTAANMPSVPVLAAQTGGIFDIIGNSSGDPQVYFVAIFATVDGGTTPFFVDMIQNNPTGTDAVHHWHFVDNTPDSELNILMAAPQAFSNDPAPKGITNLVFHLGRMWGAVGNVLYTSGGPDTLVGNGAEAWPPANNWNYPSQIVKLIAHNTGLIVFTRSGVFLHGGGPAISQFYPQPLFDRIGVSSWNAVDATNNEVTLFTSGRQLLTIDLLNNSLTDIGFSIQDQLQNLDPTAVYVVRHHAGLDDAVFIADGSTGWFKCVPRQPPDYSITGPIWSPKAEVLA